MRTLIIKSFPEKLYRWLEELAHAHGRSVGEQALEMLKEWMAVEKGKKKISVKKITPKQKK